ncbi:O-antigen ligase family protein [Flavobacterium chuncheonense]|uniref:O-antigen ligase family protein n=1 Tax=Flavobacterium chuncheonense TaxID=2026653 RepID=A0ABW5YMF2_9FLAO
MKISEGKFNKIYNFLLLVVSLALPFGKLSNLAIILFVLFNLLFFKQPVLNKKIWKIALLMLIPLLLETLFFWNNDAFAKGIKSLLKYISLLAFTFFIIGHYKRVKVNQLLRRYAISMTLILLSLEIRFVIFFQQYIQKYLNGIDLWEVGYVFTQSFKVHAPAINLQLVFVACVNLYFLIQSFIQKSALQIKLINLGLVFIATIHVMVVNTRVSLVCLILCFIFMIFYEVKKQINLKKALLGTFGILLLLSVITTITVYSNPFMIEKYTTFTFSNLDKVGKLDEMEHPEIYAFNGLVNRLSIWKSALELANENWLTGVGASDANKDLIQYFKDTNQNFLAKYEFATHNQYLNYYLKFGFMGLILTFCYVFGQFYLGVTLKNGLIIAFALLFTISNLTDDFLNRFDGIGFSGFFYSIFIVLHLKWHSDKLISSD